MAATAAGALAQAVLRGMSATRLKVMAALAMIGALVFGTGMLAHQAQAQRPDAAATAVAAPPGPAPAAPSPAKDAEEAKKAVTGRVLDADGKPIKGAVVTGSAGLEFGSLSVQYQAKALGEVKTDADGRFRLPVSLASGERTRQVELLVCAKGYGPAWSRAVPVGGTDVELRLPTEEAVVGRLLDLQGQPLAKAQLRPRRVLRPVLPRGPKVPGSKEDDAAAEAMRHNLALHRRSHSFEFWKDSPIKDFPLWPQAVTTDAEGRFRVTGFGRGQEVDLLVEDGRVAAQEITVAAGDRERSFSLVPPHKVSGRVVAADTDKPVAGASVWVTSFHDRLGYGTDARTDAEGRFSVNAYPGESYSVAVYPQKDEPYLSAFESAAWPKGTVKQEVDFKLPRGVVVRGKVVEAGSGKAIRSAAIAFLPQGENNSDLPRGIVTGRYHRVWSGADGTFQIVFPAGRGHMVVTGPDADYAYRTISEGELQTGKPGGAPHHFHAVLPLELKAKGSPKELKVELLRSVTIKGRVVGPDGKPVKDAVAFIPSELLPPDPNRGLALAFGVPPDAHLTAVPVRDGAFELPNCDPDKTYRVFVLSGCAEGGMMIHAGPPRIDVVSVVNRLISEKDLLGVVAELSAKKAAGKPVEVKLSKCESAQVRFVDAEGKAVQQKMWLELLVKPGPSMMTSRAEGKAAGEGALLATPYSLRGEKSPVAADADGRITIPGLIPGATYRIKVMTGQQGLENETIFEKDFTVEAGKKIKLELVAPETK
jgi:hypothetical protein